MSADLILVGRVLTGEPERPPAEAAAIAGGRFGAVGPRSEVMRAKGVGTIEIGGAGAVVVPGFVDAHLHFVAAARRASEVDCSAPACATVEAILQRLAAAADRRPRGAWIRAFGYDESLLAERRTPSLDELDRALPDHPLRLLHRTGHAAVLNRAALHALGIDASDPRLERAGRGRITGLVLEPGRWLRVPAIAGEELRRLCAAASERLLAAGITTFHDPTPGPPADRVDRFRSMIDDGTLRQRVRVYASSPPAFSSEPPGAPLRWCGVKIVITEGEDAARVFEDVAAADARGAQIAIHAVEEGPLALAVAALARLGRDAVRRRRHRLEHASLCPPPLAEAIALTGATVVTQPAFLTCFGDKYRREIPHEQRAWLYPLRGFRALGIPVAFGSDGPIAEPRPLAAIAAAAARADGLGERQAVSAAAALDMHTVAGAAAAGEDDVLGRIRGGALADAVVLDRDPTAIDPAEIADIRVRATIVGGRVAWAP